MQVCHSQVSISQSFQQSVIDRISVVLLHLGMVERNQSYHLVVNFP